MCALVVALPRSASAQTGEEGASAEPSPKEPVQSTQPTESRLERWHPEAFADPSKPAAEPALELELDSAGLEVTPAAPLTVEELKRQETKQRKRRTGIAVGVSLVLVVGLVVGVGVGVSVATIKREGT